jgi:hypothetical protein
MLASLWTRQDLVVRAALGCSGFADSLAGIVFDVVELPLDLRLLLQPLLVEALAGVSGLSRNSLEKVSGRPKSLWRQSPRAVPLRSAMRTTDSAESTITPSGVPSAIQRPSPLTLAAVIVSPLRIARPTSG